MPGRDLQRLGRGAAAARRTRAGCRHHRGHFRLRQNESGVDTIRRLRERLGDVPALLVTGDTAPERLREAQASGLPLLHKPVQGDTLVQAMLAALQR